jgi:hypothetical protein
MAAVVHSSCGDFYIDPETGDVLDYIWEEQPDEHYAQIVRFDLSTAYGRKSDYDILWLGYWLKDGMYFRRERKPYVPARPQ